MCTYPLNPGAGLAAGSLLRPPPAVAPNSALRPPPAVAPDAALRPPPRPPNAGDRPPPKSAPVRGRQPDTVEEAIDPDWTFSAPEALMARALWRTRTKINPDAFARVPTLPSGVPAAPLDRWGSEHRVLTVASDLAWRWFVAGDTLHRVERRSRGMVGHKVLQLHKLPKDRYPRQVDKVLRAAVEREERLPEILVQVYDFWSFYNAITGFDPARAPRCAELFDIAWTWAQGPVMALKHGLAGDGSESDPSLRPHQRNTLVQPVIETPSHGSYPSGHASMAFFTSELLFALLAKPDLALDRLARRITFNRTVAGLHFPVDNAAGAALGRQMAALFVGWATGTARLGNADFDPNADGCDELKEAGMRKLAQVQPTPIAASDLLASQWTAATRELHQLGLGREAP
jgi:PAP2 superfamily